MRDERLILALDLDSGEEALEWVDRFRRRLTIFKIGPQLFLREGRGLIDAIRQRNCEVFLDLKFHDIPEVVACAVHAAIEMDVKMLSVHASGGLRMIEAAVEASQNRLQLVAVTTLSSMPSARRAIELGTMAVKAGAKGVIASPHEAGALRAHLPKALIITPGIRLIPDADTMTPDDAFSAGATHLVVGRPILLSSEPEKTVENFLGN